MMPASNLPPKFPKAGKLFQLIRTTPYWITHWNDASILNEDTFFFGSENLHDCKVGTYLLVVESKEKAKVKLVPKDSEPRYYSYREYDLVSALAEHPATKEISRVMFIFVESGDWESFMKKIETST